MSVENSSEPELLNFFIFNASYGQKEGHEHEKVLFYHPSSTEIDIQVRHVGLAEAITRFSSTFKKDGDCEAVHTQKTRQAFYQPEPNIWMVLTVSVGWITKKRDTGPVREYQSEGVQDVVLRARLVNMYRAFTLQHASFTRVQTSSGLQALKSTLNSFFSSYLSSVEVSGGDILSVWSGVSFLPLDRQTFLRIHCCLSLLQGSFPSISHTAFFYNNHVVWCGLGMEDLRSLSQYLNNQLLPGCLSSSSAGHPSKASSYLSRYRDPGCRFVGIGVTPSIQIHAHNESRDLKPYHLLVYTLAGATVCLTLPGNFMYYQKSLGVTDSSDFWQLSCRLAQESAMFSLNRSCHSHTHHDESIAVNPLIANHRVLSVFLNYVLILFILEETSATFFPLCLSTDSVFNYRCNSGELVVKTSQDHWVVGRCGDGREFYVVVSHKNANLVEVTDEVNRMCSSHFSNIFMVE
ncbi:vacuolar fusion protein CCZ1 homolog [Penaeus monodon]|uniref:vacuolar fusion protein CCZ1 homolog n=1 Tax=Penaeus monodon TaxID=6687 RepID=UPI0018A76CE4|nr:vacuolar fusion protein CCZ1 homolog [Penaeus monodon]